ncbi:hypothetical protein LCGC14_2240550 [marine sediment metagenome]|uniref:Uncharacterized protein n=1 Tax=marine sediment metagenome TaxID=412755 RepID=A0A0F9DT57_9ZZZZ
MTDARGRDQEVEATYSVELTRRITVVAKNDSDAIQRAIHQAGHLMIAEGPNFVTYFGYEVVGAESMATPEDVAAGGLAPD